MRKTVCFVLLSILMLISSPALSAESVLSELVEESLKEALIGHGISAREASELSSRYAFIAAMMTGGGRQNASDAARETIEDISDSGTALGSAIGVMIDVYGRSDLQEMVSVMLLTARAGIAPMTSSQLFAKAASCGFDLGSALKILVDTAEAYRQLQSDDRGVSISSAAAEMIEQGSSAEEISAALSDIWKAEHDRRMKEIAAAEAERLRRDNRGGGDSLSSGSDERGGYASSGGGSSGAASDSSSSGGEVSSASGSDESSSSDNDDAGEQDADSSAEASDSSADDTAGDAESSSENDEKDMTAE